MKRFNILCFLLVPLLGFGQENQLSVYLSATEISLGNNFTIKFEINNRSATFVAPTFDGMRVILGPHVSSSFSIVNGNASQSLSYEYILHPLDVGQKFIGSASFNVRGEIIESVPIEIVVLENHDHTIYQQGRLKKVFSSSDSTQLRPIEYGKKKEKLKQYRKKY